MSKFEYEMLTLRFTSLCALTLTLDLATLLAAVPLARYSLQAAREDPSNNALLLALLAANLGLLLVLFFGFYVNGLLLRRIAARSSQLRHILRGNGKEGSRLCDTSTACSTGSERPTS